LETVGLEDVEEGEGSEEQCDGERGKERVGLIIE
jgi:hypothetical protein